MAEILASYPTATLGECGLDRWITTPPIEIQMPVFLAQLRLANLLDIPITIHCLKAWEKLFEAFSEVAPPSRFLLHSFTGSIEIARRLIPLGAYFSFSGHFLHERKAQVREVFRQLPHDRILLESDGPSMLPPPQFVTHPLSGDLNHPGNLPAIGAGLATILGLSVQATAELTRINSNYFSNRKT